MIQHDPPETARFFSLPLMDLSYAANLEDYHLARAFEGQAKYLITRLHFAANRIASIWKLEDGCGGGA